MEEVSKYLPEGTLLRNGTYSIECQIASGGFGNTYLVRHIGFDAKMVIKEFFMKGINLRDESNTVTVSVPDNRATFESQRAKFKKEAQRLWKLKSDHIVGVHDIFEENGTVYYVMDLIEGESLEARLKREGTPLQEGEVRDILNQLLDALATIHNDKPKPIFHLDIKPSNILLGRDGGVILIDFGASKQLSGEREGVTSTMITYTRGYAPTEQVDGKLEHIGAWTDLYAVGATLYRLLSFHQPPAPLDIIDEGAEAFQFPTDVSEQMKRLIAWLMQPNRNRRPQSVREVLEWLDSTSKQKMSNDIETIGTGSTSNEAVSLPPPQQPIVEGMRLVKWLWKKRLPRMRYGSWVIVAIGCFAVIFSTWHSCEFIHDSEAAPKKGASQLSQIHSDDEITFTVKGVSFKMIKVNGGTFAMGATYEQGNDSFLDEKPMHQVSLSSWYYLGETEVTQELWKVVMKDNPCHFRGSTLPVENVSWNECRTFISKLNAMTGENFRLPSEAEWEFAARGGNRSKGYKYSGSNTLDDVAWYVNNSGGKTHPVKTKSPNELGLYDMSGNVWEWCHDWFGKDYYFSSPQTDPQGPSSGSNRLRRGGSWICSAMLCRVSHRDNHEPDYRFDTLGFRLAL